MGELGFCHLSDLIKEINLRLLSDITTDGGVPIWLVRMLHNKIAVGAFLSSRCYLQYLDPAQIVTFVSPFLLPFIVYAFIAKKGRKILLTFILIMPLIFIFTLKSLSLGTKIYLYKGIFLLMAFWGFMKLNWKFRSGK